MRQLTTSMLRTFFVRTSLSVTSLRQGVQNLRGLPGIITESRISRHRTRESTSVGHRVDHVIDADADAKGSEAFRVGRVVGPFPRVADVRFESDSDRQTAFVIVDAAPPRRAGLTLIRSPAVHRPPAGHL